MEKQKCDKKLHNFMLLLLWSVAIIWGLGFVLTKILLDYLSPSMINIMRFGVSAVVLFCIYFKRIIHIKWKDIGYGAVTSIFLILGFLVQTYGIDKTSPSNSALLTGLNVVMVPFLAWLFFKKRPPVKSFVSAILAVVSISLISFGGFSKINIGDFLCFLCAICFALHYIIISKTSKLVDAAVLAFLQMFFAAVAFTIIGFCFERDALLGKQL